MFVICSQPFSSGEKNAYCICPGVKWRPMEYLETFIAPGIGGSGFDSWIVLLTNWSKTLSPERFSKL